MSGRLTILPKKTYCPWKPENVERVLRDERLERERQQAAAVRSLGDEDDARRRRRRYDEGGHINLFPEAKDAELRLLTGGRAKSKAKTSSSSDAVEVLPPAPLGGDEAAKRRSGNVPFYMRQSLEGREKYDNNNGSSFRLGDNRATGVLGDEITGKITKDQFARREDDRKDKMDPMSRFYIDPPDPSCSNTSGIATAKTSARSTRKSHDSAAYKNQSDVSKTSDIVGQHDELSRDERRTKRRNHKSKRRRRMDDSSVQSSSSTISLSSHTLSADKAYHRRRTCSSGRHRKTSREGSSSGSEDERHRRKRSLKRKSGDERRNHRHRQRHDHEHTSQGN